MLDFDRVLLCFQQLSGCRAEKVDEVAVLVMSAVRSVEESIDEERMRYDAVPACEYAAACTAVYDYVCREAGRERNAVTASGSADLNRDLTHRIKAAEKLKDQAMARIEWLMPEGGFIFRTM